MEPPSPGRLSLSFDVNRAMQRALDTIDKNLVIKEVTEAGFRLDKEGNMLSRADDTRDFSVTKVRDRSDRFVLDFEKP